jgi:hypothetical protein
MFKSVIAGAALLGAIFMVGCGGSTDSGGGGGNGDLPAFLKVSAFANEAGPADTYWARSSSMDNANHGVSSPLRVMLETGDVHLGDSFYIGKRSRWQLWVTAGDYPAAATYNDNNGLFTFEESQAVHYRVFHEDDTVTTYDGGTVHLELVKDVNRIKLLKFTPAVPDEETPGEVTLIVDQPVTDTQIGMEFSDSPF